jgi:hypothetical protein
VDRYRHRATSVSSADTTIPPLEVVMILLPLNENAAARPNEPAGAPACEAPSDSAASATIGTS